MLVSGTKEDSHHWVPAQELPFDEIIPFASLISTHVCLPVFRLLHSVISRLLAGGSLGFRIVHLLLPGSQIVCCFAFHLFLYFPMLVFVFVLFVFLSVLFYFYLFGVCFLSCTIFFCPSPLPFGASTVLTLLAD